MQIAPDPLQLDVREVPAFDRDTELRVDRIDLAEDSLRLGLLAPDGSGVGGCGAGSCQSCREYADNCRYVADPNPNNGLPVRGQD